MREITIKPKYIKYIGAILLVLQGLDIPRRVSKSIHYYNIDRYGSYNTSFYISVILGLSQIAALGLGIAFLLKDKKVQEITFSVTMIAVGVLQLVVSFSCSFNLIVYIIASAYAAIGIIGLTGFKRAKIGVMIELGLIAFNTIVESLGYFMDFLYTASECSILYIPQLLGVLIYLLMHMKSSETKQISLDSGVIDFKMLLQFIDREYKAGNITEDEYNRKRAEIISKI